MFTCCGCGAPGDDLANVDSLMGKTFEDFPHFFRIQKCVWVNSMIVSLFVFVASPTEFDIVDVGEAPTGGKAIKYAASSP